MRIYYSVNSKRALKNRDTPPLTTREEERERARICGERVVCVLYELECVTKLVTHFLWRPANTGQCKCVQSWLHNVAKLLSANGHYLWDTDL